MGQTIVVVGAGIIGISSALKLQSEGHQVTVVDREGVAAETSRGNAGAFAFTDIVPLATPGIMRKAPKWLLDPLGPLSVPPSYLPKIAPWLLRFWRASWRDRYTASMTAQAALMQLSKSALERQIRQVDGESLIQREGQLQLYEGKKEFDASLEGWALRERHGIEFRFLKGTDEIAEVQPGLHSRFDHAVFTPDWINTVDPLKWTKHLAEKFVANGGALVRAEVENLENTGARASLVTSQGTMTPDRIIVAAGAWSHVLARSLGDRIPLETERGYNTTLPKGAFDLRTHLTFGGHGFVVTKINDGVRVGGAVELGGLKAPPKWKRADTLLGKAAKFLPGLDTSGGEQWMGFRPSLPDSLPVIGASPRAANVIYAFGHGHLGLTQSAGTAEIVSDLIQGQPPSLPMDAFSASRFHRGSKS